MRKAITAAVLAAGIAIGGGVAVTQADAHPATAYNPPIDCGPDVVEYAIGTGPLVLAYICPGVPGAAPFTVTDSVPDVVTYALQTNGRVKVTCTPRAAWAHIRHSVTVRYL